jgi:hypothetical protein
VTGGRAIFLSATITIVAACGGGGDAGDAGDAGGIDATDACKCVDAPPTGPTTVTVLNAGGTALVSFPFDATGDVAPTSTISGAQTNLGQASAISADASGNLYVSTPLAILVFAPFTSGNIAPARTTDDFVSVAVTPDGTIYATSEFTGGTNRSPKILVFSPGANGDVAPSRTITGATTGMQSVLSTAASPTLIAVADATQKALFFDASASGDVAPQRTLSTGAGIAEGMALDANGELFLARYEFSSSALVEWASGASGTAAPTATVTGTTTTLTTIGGVASAPDGTTFVTNADPSGAAVLVFASGANGDVAPLRSIKGASTTLSGDASQYPMPLVIY